MSKSRASVKVTRTVNTTKVKVAKNSSSKGSGQKRCSACGRYM